MPNFLRLIVLLGVLIAAVASPAAAQPASPRVLESLRTHFPEDHSALAARLAGQSPEAARLMLAEALEKFQQERLQAILAAPGARLIAIEARHGALLRALQARDMRLCAVVGDRGFFSREARAGPAPEGLDDYAIALIEAAAAGRGRAAPRPAAKEDFQAWLVELERRDPSVPVRFMLQDRELRRSSSDEHLCVGAALMHEAAAALPPEQAARVAATLIRSVIGAGMAAP
ncbi:MAG TPA: hypothetical protein VIT45_14605 [Allosphingosinicella sp.]